MSRIGLLVPIAALLVLVVLPIGTMVSESVTVGEVRTKDGQVFRGMLLDRDETVVRIRPRDTGRTEDTAITTSSPSSVVTPSA